MSFKRISKAWCDQIFLLGAGFPPEIDHPSNFVARWNMSYEDNDALVELQDAYYDKWLGDPAKVQAAKEALALLESQMAAKREEVV